MLGGLEGIHAQNCDAAQDFTVDVQRTSLNTFAVNANYDTWAYNLDPLGATKYEILDDNGNQIECVFRYAQTAGEFQNHDEVFGLPEGDYEACIGILDVNNCYKRICVPFTNPGCVCLGTEFITQNTVWTGQRFQQNNVVVMPGARLTYQNASTIILPQCRIVVERGARLDAISSNFIGECGPWEGIEVYGNPTLPQPLDLSDITSGSYPQSTSDHGVIYFLNSNINLAKIGLSAAAGGLDNYLQQQRFQAPEPLSRQNGEGHGSWWGGIIVMDGGSITNTDRGMWILKYPHDPSGGAVPAYPTISTIMNATFIGQGPPTRGDAIAVWGVDQLVVDNNTFYSWGGNDMTFLNATATITRNRNQNLGASDPRNFAVHVTHTPDHNSRFPFTIGSENHAGSGNLVTYAKQAAYYLNGVKKAQVSLNTIFRAQQAGIRFDERSEFRAYGNEISASPYGLYLSNTASGNSNISECNQFTCSRGAVEIAGNNRDYTFVEERFLNANVPDIRLRRQGGVNGSIALAQGVRGAAVLNSWGGDLNVNSPVNGTTELFYYFGPEKEGDCNLIPACYIGDPNCTTGFQNYYFSSQGLLSKLPSCVCSPDGGIGPGYPQPCQDFTCYEDLLERVTDFEPGGPDANDPEAELVLAELYSLRAESANFLAEEAYVAEDWTTLQLVYALENDRYSMPKLADYQLRAAAYADVEQTIQSFSEDIPEVMTLRTLYRTGIQARQTGIDSIDEAWLTVLALDDEALYQSAAQGLLNSYTGTAYLPSWPETIEELRYEPEKSKRKADKVEVWPNPASTVLFVVNLPEDLKELRVIDAFGRQLSTIAVQFSKAEVAVDHLPPGFYILSDANGIAHARFTVQNR